MTKRILCLLLALCLLSACGSQSGSNAPLLDTTELEAIGEEVETEIGDTLSAILNKLDDQDVPTAAYHQEEQPPYEAPPFAGSAFHDTEAVDDIKLDLSATADGYVAVSATSESRLKFQVLKDETTYTYDIASDGTPSIFPLQSGSGHYTFRVMENVVDTKYAEKHTFEADVALNNEYDPFLRPSDYVDYSESSQCVTKAAELAKTESTAIGVVGAVFDYICQQVTYDKEKAANVETGYLPDPDETMTSGKGICFDYAALAAAMLRSQGIPTKVIFGYVSPDDVYHAWNMFYTDETGWVTVDYQVSEDSWNRLDLTFSANGADETFIGDGGNYADVYIY